MNYTANIIRERTCDVVVVGGGTAGVFAAISAAKSGAKTVLVEKNAVLGGTMTVAAVNFPGLFHAWGERIIGGPCFESIERTIALGGAKMPEIKYKPEKHWHQQITLNRFVYTAILFEMCREAGVELLCNTMISDVIESPSSVRVVLTDKEGLLKIEAKCAVDTTGDASLVRMAGYPLMKSEPQQPATLQNHISGYDLSEKELLSLECEIEEKRSRFSIPNNISTERILSYLRNHKFDIHTPSVNADTSEGKTNVDASAYSTMLSVYSLLRTLRGLENLEVDFAATETGIRETSRIVGEHIISDEEYLSAEHYPDSVCYAFYPIDKHVMTGVEKKFIPDGLVPKVPYSALIPKGAMRILAAGRCISSDTDANSALRVEAVCMATAQAAGCAAAICAKDNIDVSDVPYHRLTDALRAIGAIVPDKK